MSISAFIIARLNSKRLPSKNTAFILGAPLISHLIDRISFSKFVDNIIITTSNEPTDNTLENIAHNKDVLCYRGSLDNIMQRISCAADYYDCDTIIEILGDNPLVHSKLIDDVMEFYIKGNYDYVATVTSEYPLFGLNKKLFPIGIRIQVYSRIVANRFLEFPDYINNSSKHPSSFIYDHPDIFKIGYFEAKGSWAFLNHPDLNFAVNYQKDLDIIRDIFDNCYNVSKNFSLRDVAQYLNINSTD